MQVAIPMKAQASGTTLRDAKLTLELVQQGIKSTEHSIKAMQSQASHPQVAVMIAKAEARLETLLAVEASMFGNKVALRVLVE